MAGADRGGCIRYTPMVALDPPGGLMLDISGCPHLFGGEKAWHADVETALAAIGMAVRTALADTPGCRPGARSLRGRGCDQAVAVAALELEPEATEGLVRAGLKTMARWRRRPMAGVSQRASGPRRSTAAASAGRVDQADRADPSTIARLWPSGASPSRSRRPNMRFDRAWRACRRGGGQLEERTSGGRRFEATFFRSDGLVAELSVETGQPTREPR